MGWAESRTRLAESSIEDLYRRLKDLLDQVTALRQSLRAASQALPYTGTQGSVGGVFLCIAPSAVNAVWSGGAPSSPGSFSATVYQCTGTTVATMGTQTVYNWMVAATVPGKACLLVPDSQGNYVVVSQSCT